MRVVCPTLHAEQLHREAVWTATRNTVAKSGLRWTIFVEPLEARIRGIDLARQLSWFAEHGHEVAMHTHHHVLQGPEGRTTGYVKGQRLTARDMQRCLGETFEYLHERGHRPKGFVSGTWLVLDPIFEWLASNGFDYDCTLRTYAAAGPYSRLIPDTVCPSPRPLLDLIEIPTTSFFRRYLRDRILLHPRSVRIPDLQYDLYFLHDYDLVNRSKRVVLRALAKLERSAENLTVQELAHRIRAPRTGYANRISEV